MPGVGRRRRRHRRHQRDDRPLPPLPAAPHPAVRRRPRGLGVLPRLARRRPGRRDRPASRIEGIGRPRVEPSFVPDVVDRMICVPDAASLAAMRATSSGSPAGGSAARPAPTCGAPSGLVAEMRRGRRAPAASSPCSATAASGTPTPTTTTPGWRPRGWTSRRTPPPCSSSPRPGEWRGRRERGHRAPARPPRYPPVTSMIGARRARVPAS